MQGRVVMRLFSSVVLCLLSFDLFAVQPQQWRVSTPEEFIAGESEGFAITSRGELQASPTVEKLATFSDPFVLSQTSSKDAYFFGTGNEGKVYRLRGRELKLLFTAAEPEVYAVTINNGSLLVATSPNGRVYKVDTESGASSVFFDPKQAYIWAMTNAVDGSLYVATGIEGKVFKVSAKGEGKIWYDATEVHIRSMAVRGNNSLLLGGSGSGRIYEVDSSGRGRVIHDSSFTEIAAIFVDPSTGVAWASGVTNVLPTSAPLRVDAPKTATAAPSSGDTTAAPSPDQPAEVSVSFGTDAGITPSGAAELYRIDADGYVETVRKFDKEVLYAISGGPGGSLYLATGPLGRIYQYADNDISLAATVAEKQLVSVAVQRGATIVTTTNSGGVYRLTTAGVRTAEFRSPVKDTERFSSFGFFKVEGKNLGQGLRFSVRSGNTNVPDENWSEWQPQAALQGDLTIPSARYLQWKLNLVKASADALVESVGVWFLNRNVAPVIDSLTVAEPGVIFVSTAFPASPQVVEATNPDEFGIFASLDAPRDRSDGGKRMFRKGFRTVTWKARDENNDALRYLLQFRRKGDTKWLRLRENIEETQLNFDTSRLPDGMYELLLTASDSGDNPDIPLKGTRQDVEFLVDNSSPMVTYTRSNSDALVTVSDQASAILRVEYSVDADKWLRITPVDGIADSPQEQFRIPASALANRFVIVRAVDQSFNVVTRSIDLSAAQ